ncbi:MAG: c-type cytochrome [Acidimicrobiia bacterium]
MNSMNRTIRAVALCALILAACGGEETVELSPAAIEGRQIAGDLGCAACHGVDGQGGVGPAWVGLAGSEVELADGSVVLADTEYLRRSITDPEAEVVAGYTTKMPENTLSDDQVDAVVAYIEELR